MDSDNRIVWEHVRSALGLDLRLFRVRFDWLKNRRNGHTVKATVLESPDWVNVVALTPRDKFVVVRQYRFGTAKTTTEIPAGIVEPGETHRQAAERELKEETGYTSQDWQYLGYVEPNPAFLNNKCHHWLARKAERTSEPVLDVGENMLVSEMSLDEVRLEVERGLFRHSLALTALAHLFDLRPLLASGSMPERGDNVGR
ncbi:MAG: NUDIX hydrolase [Candidatus Eisenbacteria bacterium]|nr:NUDIX hydrolase [Candidatus Eisenbacteria bacterium]